MIGLVRNAVILFAALVLAVLIVAAGEGTCGGCVHGCCVRTDGPRRVLSSARRIFRMVIGLVGAESRTVAHGLTHGPCHVMHPTPWCEEVTALRI